jgi:hypothetical protein
MRLEQWQAQKGRPLSVLSPKPLPALPDRGDHGTPPRPIGTLQGGHPRAFCDRMIAYGVLGSAKEAKATAPLDHFLELLNLLRTNDAHSNLMLSGSTEPSTPASH